MPLRRYLRISKYSVLEVKIYVTGNDSESWFNNAVLEEAITLARPLIFPKLREERESKKKKKQPTRDTIHGSTFSASLFLQDVETRHCILEVSKDLQFRETTRQNPVVLHGDSSPLFLPSQEEEAEQMKPVLVNSYRGTSIYGKCLCLILQASDKSNDLRENQSLETWIKATQQESYA